MAKIDYTTAMTASDSSSTGSRVGFFSLKGDGEEAVVRIMHDSTATFDILTTHAIKVKPFRVSCLRTPMEPLDKCPLCAAEYPVQTRIYVHLIQYTKNESGQIVAEPKVWERAAGFATTLKSFLDNYGPLSSIMCKIIRHGKAGDMNTTYELIPNLNQQIYRDDLYPIIPGVFDNYTALGHNLVERSAEDLSAFVANGAFPVVNNQQSAPTSYQPVPMPQAPAMPSTPAAPAYNPSASNYAAQPAEPQPAAGRQMPWENAGASTVTRPQRYY